MTQSTMKLTLDQISKRQNFCQRGNIGATRSSRGKLLGHHTGQGRSPSRRTFVQCSSTRSRHNYIGLQAIHTYSTSAVIELTFQFLITLLINFHFSVKGKLHSLHPICLYHCKYCLVPKEQHHRSSANISYYTFD
jgi:hypothetical protein